MDEKISVRISFIILAVVAIPPAMFFYFALKQYLASIKPAALDKEDYYVVCTYSGCSSYEKSLIDSPEPYQTSFQSQYYDKVQAAKAESVSERRLFYLFTFSSFCYSSIASIFYLRNKILLDNDRIFINLKNINTHYQKVEMFSQRLEFSINDIKKINIVSKTPLGPIKTKVEEVNWRDRVEIYFNTGDGAEDVAMVDIYLFPRFKKVLLEIVKRRSDIKVSFIRTTVMENLSEG